MCLREQNSCFLGPVCARDQQPTSAVRSLPFSTNNKLQKNKTFIARPKGPSPRKPSYSHRIDDPTRDDDVLKTVRCCEAPKIEGSHRLADKMEARIQKSVARFSAPAQGSWKSEGKIKPDCNSYSPGMYMGFLCLGSGSGYSPLQVTHIRDRACSPTRRKKRHPLDRNRSSSGECRGYRSCMLHVALLSLCFASTCK